MNTNNENKPAFPIELDNKERGLTKLEKFTESAMKGLCANPVMIDAFKGINQKDIDDITSNAIAIARATLAALETETKSNE